MQTKYKKEMMIKKQLKTKSTRQQDAWHNFHVCKERGHTTKVTPRKLVKKFIVKKLRPSIRNVVSAFRASSDAAIYNEAHAKTCKYLF